MVGGITLITSPSATAAIAFCAASTSPAAVACTLTPVLQHRMVSAALGPEPEL